jgi:hypothetical protein
MSGKQYLRALRAGRAHQLLIQVDIVFRDREPVAFRRPELRDDASCRENPEINVVTARPAPSGKERAVGPRPSPPDRGCRRANQSGTNRA